MGAHDVSEKVSDFRLIGFGNVTLGYLVGDIVWLRLARVRIWYAPEWYS